MADDKKQFNQNGYLMLNGPDDTLWIPRSSNKSWLTLFYALPRVMVEKQKEYFSLPRCPYEVLRTEKYDELINDDLFLQLVWDCYAWMIFQRIPIPLKDGTYRFIPGADLHYSGNFPLWRMSYYMVGIMRDMFEQFGTSFQALFKVKKGDEIPYIPYEKWAVFIGDMTTAIIVKRNLRPMIDNIWNTRTPEDYSEYYSRIKANFESQWFHERTNVGKGMRSIEEMMEASDENGIRFDVPDKKDYTEEVINRMAWERFTSTLSKRDREILDLKAKGFTDKEIAEKVGYKTHSAVVKRIQKIASLLEDFSREDYREYQKTFKE